MHIRIWLAGIPDAKIPPYRYHFKSELKLKDSREVCLITPKYAFNVESVPTKARGAFILDFLDISRFFCSDFISDLLKVFGFGQHWIFGNI